MFQMTEDGDWVEGILGVWGLGRLQAGSLLSKRSRYTSLCVHPFYFPTLRGIRLPPFPWAL